MKLKIMHVILVSGLVILIGIIIILTRALFSMSVPDSTSHKKSPVPAASRPQPVANALIEVGKDSFVNRDKDIAKSLPASAAGSSTTPGKSPAAATTSNPIGKVVHLAGTATVTSLTGAARIISLNADIFRGEKIETRSNTKLEIKLTDGTVLSQGENSIIAIDECVYDPSSAPRCSFIMRFMRGTCRVMTGLITDLNPDRFKVRAKMATVGIRGCDLVFKSTDARDDIYILDLGMSKAVTVEASSDGSQLMESDTGKTIPLDPEKKSEFNITEPQTVVSVTRGKGAEQRGIGPEESRGLITETSHLTPARYELQQKADGAVLKISPDK